MPNAFITANKLFTDTGSCFFKFAYADKSDYTSGSCHMPFPAFWRCSNGSAHGLAAVILANICLYNKKTH